MQKYKVAIIGATGFTGSELVRILVHHPNISIEAITSESRNGEQFSDVHPFFQGICDMKLIKADELEKENIDLAFLALPHGVSMDYVEKFKDAPFKMVDLSGDFRLSTPSVYTTWYKKEHTFPEGFEKAVYGLPEINREAIEEANLVANPGCYPTSAILGLAPLLEADLVSNDRIIVDAKSGVTGAGVKSKAVNHFSTVNDNFKAYGLKNHRHSIEIQENANRLGGNESKVQFTPHLLPVDRGILSTIYATPKSAISERDVADAFSSYYRDAPFVRIRKSPPAIKDVRGTNYCDIYSDYDERTNNIIVISAIDNLVKGAAGQAVQNMNLMLSIKESIGLNQIPLQP